MEHTLPNGRMIPRIQSTLDKFGGNAKVPGLSPMERGQFRSLRVGVPGYRLPKVTSLTFVGS